MDHESVRDLSRALLETREQAVRIVDFLKENLAGFEHTYISSLGSQLGIRDRKGDGIYTIPIEAC